MRLHLQSQMHDALKADRKLCSWTIPGLQVTNAKIYSLTMNIDHIKLHGRGAFIVKDGPKRLAEMTYSLIGDEAILIEHTAVDESLRGQKVGDRLLAEAVEFARTNKLKVRATCPFALSRLRNSPDFSDVFEDL